MQRLLTPALLALCLASPALADDVSDGLQAALDAYNAGDLGKATEDLTLATQALRTAQAGLLAGLLPAAPDGFTREDTADFAQSMAVAGGGTGAEATYTSADGNTSFKLSFIADNPMVSSMGAMLGNVQMITAMGKLVKVGDQPLLSVDNSISGLVNGRVLFQAQGAGVDEMQPLVDKIDFAKVAAFDKK